MLLYTLIMTGGSASGLRNSPAVDEDLIARVALDDMEAFALLYEETKSAVYGFALSLVRSKAAAEDIMQDAYLRIFHAAAGYTPQGKPMAWILTIVRNLSLMKLREGPRHPLPLEEDWSIEESRSLVEDRLDQLVLEAALRELGEEERQVVMLHSLSGMKFREIAELLELPLSTVLSKNRRALSKLKKTLEEEDRDER